MGRFLHLPDNGVKLSFLALALRRFRSASVSR